MSARALSTCDVDDALTDENGMCLPSKSGVSEVPEALWAEYEAFQARDLSMIPVLYVLLDGLYEPLRTHGIEREAVLCAWAITLESKKVLLSLSLGNKESYEARLGFRRDLVSRGLPHPADGDHRRRTRPAAGRGRGVGGQSALALLGPSHAQLSSQSAPLTLAGNQSAPASHP